MRSSLSKNRGITFLELIVAFAVTAIILPAIITAFSYGLRYQAGVQVTTAAAAANIRLEEKIRKLISSAMLTSDTTDTNSYFVLTQSSGSQSNLGDSLVFTGFGEAPPGSVLGTAVTDDFQTLNDQAGPQGGLEEVSLSLTAVGDVGDKTGLFLREQRPPDSDPTQGGLESLMDPDVQSLTFECYDGQTWQQSWDTRSGSRRLPAAVRVTYVLRQDPATQHVFVVRLPMSDVTSTNPVTTSGGTTQ